MRWNFVSRPHFSHADAVAVEPCLQEVEAGIVVGEQHREQAVGHLRLGRPEPVARSDVVSCSRRCHPNAASSRLDCSAAHAYAVAQLVRRARRDVEIATRSTGSRSSTSQRRRATATERDESRPSCRTSTGTRSRSTRCSPTSNRRAASTNTGHSAIWSRSDTIRSESSSGWSRSRACRRCGATPIVTS